MSEHRLEVADVFRIHEDDFLAQWGQVLSREQRKAFADIRYCRTAALGGHMEQFDCGHRVPVYNSCVMGSNSLWGVERGNRRKSNHSKPLFLPIKNLGLPRRAAPVGRVDPDTMPQVIRSRLGVQDAHE